MLFAGITLPNLPLPENGFSLHALACGVLALLCIGHAIVIILASIQ